MKHLLIFYLIISSDYVSAQSHQQIAYRYAPIHYQDTDNSNAKADYIARFNFDNNWFGDDNWDHLNTGTLNAYAYYAVTESATHWFVLYMFYHPRDWTDNRYDANEEHENDAEGLLIVVKKGGSLYGSFVAMLTVAHGGIYSYVPEISNLTRNNSVFSGVNFNGTARFQDYDGSLHPKTVQNAKGHGCYAFPSGDFSGGNGQDGIIYYPSLTTSELPESGNDRKVKYKLVDVTKSDLWLLQLSNASSTTGSRTYFSWGVFAGNGSGGCGDLLPTCPSNAAQAPWQWPFSNYERYRGLLALDPIKVVNDYFRGLGNFSLTYTSNKFLMDLKLRGYNEENKSRGWPGLVRFRDLYAKLP